MSELDLEPAELEQRFISLFQKRSSAAILFENAHKADKKEESKQEQIDQNE